MTENNEPFGKFDNKFLEKLNKSLLFYDPISQIEFCSVYCDKKGIDCNEEYRRWHKHDCKHIKALMKNFVSIENREFYYDEKNDCYLDSCRVIAISLNRENFLIEKAKIVKFDNKIHRIQVDNRKSGCRTIYIGKHCYSIEYIRCAFKLVENPEILLSFKPDWRGCEDDAILIFRNDKITFGIAPRTTETEEESEDAEK